MRAGTKAMVWENGKECGRRTGGCCGRCCGRRGRLAVYVIWWCSIWGDRGFCIILVCGWGMSRAQNYLSPIAAKKERFIEWHPQCLSTAPPNQTRGHHPPPTHFHRCSIHHKHTTHPFCPSIYLTDLPSILHKTLPTLSEPPASHPT